jgi:uncharacterized protein DUF4331
MKRPLFSRTLSLALALTVAPIVGFAADHGDVPAAGNDPTADITDLYAWMSADASKLNLALDVYPNAGASASFSPAVVYAFSISSSQMYGGPQQSKKLLCKFADATNIECWLNGEYVAGNPSATQGITSASGKLRVYAGRRDDPFFLNYVGFGNTVNAAVQAAGAGMVKFDDQQCAQLTLDQQNALVGLLTHGDNGANATNTFAGQAVLALVLQVDKSLVDDGGPILGVWASTHSVQ